MTHGSNLQRLKARKRIMNIGTWNIQSISNKFEEVLNEMKTHDIDIAALTETKKKGTGTEDKMGYIHIYSGVPKEERARSGVSIIIKKKFKSFIKTWEQISDRIIKVQMNIMGHEMVILGVYAPNDDAVTSIKDEFYQSLTRELDKVSDRKEIIIMGDLNGRVGRRVDDPVVLRFGEEVLINNGERLIDLGYRNALKITNGFFQHRDIHRFTWTQPTRHLRSIIDYILIKQQSNLLVTDVRVKRGAECGSDHYLLQSKIYFPFRKTTNAHVRADDVKPQSVETVMCNLEGLQDDSTRFLYQLRLTNKLQSVASSSPEDMYEKIKIIIHQAAAEALGEVNKTPIQRNLPNWWSEEIAHNVELKKQAYGKWLSTKSNEDRRTYCLARKEAQKSVAKAKNEIWLEAGTEINKCTGNTRANKAWKILKSLRTSNNDKCGVNLITLEQWCNYYMSLLTEDRAEFLEDVEMVCNNNEMVKDIEVTEVLEALRTMKNSKASGPGGIPIELIKYGPTQLVELITDIFNKCLRNETVPVD